MIGLLVYCFLDVIVVSWGLVPFIYVMAGTQGYGLKKHMPQHHDFSGTRTETFSSRNTKGPTNKSPNWVCCSCVRALG